MREVLQDYMHKAEAFRSDLGDKRLTVEHMLLAMAEEQRFGEIMSVAEGVDPESMKKAIRKSRVVYNRGGAEEQPVDPGVLSKYSRDLTSLAREGQLDPVVGRHGEMRRLIDVLGRRTKNSAVLVGEPGVGKTSIIHGLAQRLVTGDVPECIRGARLIGLELGLLTAGATFPGEFEERLRGVLAELTAAGSNAILFIDDIHSITGPNAQQGGGVNDASVMLKPLLARGEVRVVGCTSADKYRKFIEKDPGLERRFQLVSVDAPGVPETISILRGLRHKYQDHHGVRITDAALAAAASLSDAYLPDRHLPDKAIDLIDEAAAKVKTDLVLKPEALDKTERRIRQLESERKALQRAAELDKTAAADLAALDEELGVLREEASSLYVQLEEQLAASATSQRLQDDLDRLDADIEAAEEAGQTTKAEQLRKARRGEIIRKLRSLQRRNSAAAAAAAASSSRKGGRAAGSSASRSAASCSGGAEGEKPAGRAEVGEADVARIISSWTGIPLTKLVENEASRLLHLGDELHKRIIGQDEAVVAVSEAIQRSRAGMKDPNGPIASFLFLGPTGVGKTELAKALAAQLFNTEQAMVRLDMSEYMEKHAVAKLIGAPPGYVGFDEGGQLTEQVRRRPYCVVLFDEVEKAHVDVFNLLLQILDDGRVTDSQGRVVSFKNAIIILTSNLGSAEIFNAAYKQKKEGGQAADMRELVMERVRKHFRPEFLNRIDEFICFEPLSNEQISTIVGLRAKGVAKRVAEKKMRLELTDSAIEHLSAVGYDPVYGARPVKRAIQRELETPLAQAMLRGQFEEFDTIIVEGNSSLQQLQFSRIPAPHEMEEDADDGSSISSTNSKQQKQQQQLMAKQQQQPGEPIPVEIPNLMRHVNSFGRMAAGSSGGGSTAKPVQPAAAANGSSKSSKGIGGSGNLKYDPLAAKKKVSKPSVGQQQQHAAGDSSLGQPAVHAGVNGSSTADEPGAAMKQSDSSGSLNELMATLDADVAKHLDPANLPAFLRTPERRDGQESLPTQSY